MVLAYYMPIMQSILLVEDDTEFARSLVDTLRRKGLEVTRAATYYAGERLLSTRDYKLVIIDRILSDGDGLHLAELIHTTHYQTKVLMITTKSMVADRIEGLKAGADDYLGKPFSQQELLLKIDKLLAKEKMLTHQSITIGMITLFPQSGKLFVDGKQRVLRRREADMLACLMRYKNRVVTRQMLLDIVWSGEVDIPTYGTIDVYVRRLRMILGKKRKIIKTIRGFGYLLVAPTS